MDPSALAAPCPAPVEESAVALREALDAVLASPEVGGWMLADDGPGVGLGLNGRPTCESAAGPVRVVGWRPVTVGRTSRWRGEPVVEIQILAETPYDRIAWLSILAHEVFHIKHERVAGPAATDYRSSGLQRRYDRDPAHTARVDGLVGLAFATRADCALGELASAYATHRDALPAGLRRDEDRWATTEGLARYVEGRWEQQARREAGESWGDDLRFRACGDLSTPYGYALGCSLAAVLERCATGNWGEVVMRDGFQAALANPTGP